MPSGLACQSRYAVHCSRLHRGFLTLSRCQGDQSTAELLKPIAQSGPIWPTLPSQVMAKSLDLQPPALALRTADAHDSERVVTSAIVDTPSKMEPRRINTNLSFTLTMTTPSAVVKETPSLIMS